MRGRVWGLLVLGWPNSLCCLSCLPILGFNTCLKIDVVKVRHPIIHIAVGIRYLSIHLVAKYTDLGIEQLVGFRVIQNHADVDCRFG